MKMSLALQLTYLCNDSSVSNSQLDTATMKLIAVLLPTYAAAFAPTASRGRITTHMKGAPHDVEANIGAGWAGMIK